MCLLLECHLKHTNCKLTVKETQCAMKLLLMSNFSSKNLLFISPLKTQISFDISNKGPPEISEGLI